MMNSLNLVLKFINYFTFLSLVTTLQQRLGIPGLQCVNISELMPCKKLLLTKRSQRCRECEHNVTKPEFYPTSIKFKIQLSA